MGAERKSMVMTEKDKAMTAYHEAGHAILGRLLPDHDPVYKVSIIPRGRALGVTMFLPEEDKVSYSRRYLLSRITSAYGGRIAEEMFYGADGVSTGASNDIQQATKMARNMVTKWGLSDKAGPVLYSDEEGDPFMGQGGGAAGMNVSAETAKLLDAEIRKILDNCYEEAVTILEENRDKMELMKDALMEYETIDASQIDDIMQGRNPQPPKDWSNDGEGGLKVPADSEQDDAEDEKKPDLKKPADPLGGSVH